MKSDFESVAERERVLADLVAKRASLLEEFEREMSEMGSQEEVKEPSLKSFVQVSSKQVKIPKFDLNKVPPVGEDKNDEAVLFSPIDPQKVKKQLLENLKQMAKDGQSSHTSSIIAKHRNLQLPDSVVSRGSRNHASPLELPRPKIPDYILATPQEKVSPSHKRVKTMHRRDLSNS